MNWLRSIAAVLVGYFVFAILAFALFRISGQAPHDDAPPPFMVVSIVGGILFALAGGYVAAWIAGRKPVAHGVAVAAVLATGAALSLAATVGHGAIWSQLAALALMAPSAALGGWLRRQASQPDRFTQAQRGI